MTANAAGRPTEVSPTADKQSPERIWQKSSFPITGP
jgi:hypothetical protein